MEFKDKRLACVYQGNTSPVLLATVEEKRLDITFDTRFHTDAACRVFSVDEGCPWDFSAYSYDLKAREADLRLRSVLQE